MLENQDMKIESDKEEEKEEQDCDEAFE